MRWLMVVFLAVAGGAMVATALPRVDETRVARAVDNALTFVPDGEQVRAAASGFEEPWSDLFWVRAVLVFGERFDGGPGAWTEWLRRMLGAVNTLDPRWRTPYFYGGSMLRVAGEVEASTEVFRAGSEALPEDPFFPFSIGMNIYLYGEDHALAAEWLARAASLPGAPTWYAAAAARMRQDAGARDAAILYLREVIATTDNDGVRRDAEAQLLRLQHNALVEGWAEGCRAFRAQRGRPLESPAELARLFGHALPPSPRGDAWVVGSDGVVRGEEAERERRRKLLRLEWRILAPN